MEQRFQTRYLLLLYDEAYIEKLYRDYQNIECDDAKTIRLLEEKLADRPLLILGPRHNMEKERGKVEKFMADKKPVVISVNYAPADIEVTGIFLTKAKRYTQLVSDLHHNINKGKPILATSNVTKVEGDFPYVLNYGSLIDPDTEIIDNLLVMLRKRDLNPRAGCPTYTLSRGASSAS